MGKRGKQIAVTHSLKAANNLTPSGPGIAMIGPMRDVSAVEHNCYPILECKPVLEFSVNALEVVQFSFAGYRPRRRTHAPTADRYPPKMGVTSIFWIWLILIVDVVWRLLIMFKRLNVQFPPYGGTKGGFTHPADRYPPKVGVTSIF